MFCFRLLCSLSLLFLAAAIVLSCGGLPAHIPESVNITPATADGSNGPVQFTATAYYSTTPSPLSPASATWGACSGNMNVNNVTVSSTGKAQCLAGASQTYMIYAFVPNPAFRGSCAGSAQLPCGGSCGGVVGTAILTCP